MPKRTVTGWGGCCLPPALSMVPGMGVIGAWGMIFVKGRMKGARTAVGDSGSLMSLPKDGLVKTTQ